MKDPCHLRTTPSRALLVLVLASVGCAGSGVSQGASPSETAPKPEQRTLSQRAVDQLPAAAKDALADDPVPTTTPEVTAVSVPIEGSELVRGRSTVIVAAPIAKVREAVLDFAHYPEFMPHYSAAKVLGRTPSGAREIYMEITALHGAVKMWAKVEMPKPATVDGVEVHETKFLEGNVKDFAAMWRLRKIDDAKTELSLEVFLNPKIPLPNELINDENVSGSTKGVLAMRTHAEKQAGAAK
jgi:ribosome-associated toxin RatA of RatAB toxin-antitoxin module